MANIDKRIVEMKFDNAAFERGVSTTLSTLGKLKAGLGNLAGATKGLGDFKVNTQGLSPLGHGVDALVSKFSALQVAGVTAIANISNKAVNAGTQMVKSLTIAPISGGLGEYEKKLDSIQTILANTAAAGTDLKQVSGALEDLNRYSDQTIYNFGEMAKNIGTFTAAGVGLDTATNSIKGIANLAALSGSSSEQASTAMYQLSQAISAGKVSLMDWNSVVNAGMGGSIFQRSLAETAVAMGKLPASALKLEGAMKNVKINGQSFRESISAEGGGPTWLTSDVLTTALGNFTGDMKEADLVAQGFTKSQAAAIIAQAQTAKNAATIVKTGSKLMDTLKESAESGWAQTWEIILGDFEEAPKLWTAINNSVGGFITRAADARNKMLQVWSDNGGRQAIIQGLGNAFKALFAILKPIQQAFRELFPAMTGERLAELSKMFRNFTAGLMISGDTAQRIKSTFEGVFAIFKIGTMIISGIVKAIFSLFSTVGEGGGAVISTTATIGEFIRGIERFLSYTGVIDKFFSGIAAGILVFKPLIGFVSDLAEALSKLLTGDISGFGQGIKDAFSNLGEGFSEIADRFNKFTNGISSGFSDLAETLAKFSWSAINDGNPVLANLFRNLAQGAQFLSAFFADARGSITGLVDAIRDAGDSGSSFLAGFSGQGLSGFMDMIRSLNDKLVQLRESLNFQPTFDKFSGGASKAASGGGTALTGLVTVATTIWNALNRIFEGIAGIFGPFLSSVGGLFTTVVDKLREWFSGMDMIDFVAMVNTGVLILMFNKIRGVLGEGKQLFGNMNGTFEQLTDTLKTMQSAIKANLIMTIAIAVGVLVAALFVLAKIDAKALGIAIVALGVLMFELSKMMEKLKEIDPQSMLGASIGMIAIASALVILAMAVKILGEMDPKVLIQGGIAIAAIMAALAGMATILNGTKGIFVAAAGLLILAAAMTAMAGAIALYAAIPFAVLERGIGAMAIALLAIGVAMQAFPKGMVLKAAGITILAGAMVILTGALSALGVLPLGVITQGIIAMAASLVILAVAAHAMTGALPGAAAMLVMAGAIAVLVPAIALLGSLDFKTLAYGIGALAAIMAVFVIGMYALAPVIVVLALFSSSIMTLGLAMLAAGAGFALFVGALGALTVIGAAGFAVLVAGVSSLLALLPLMAQQLGYAIIAISKVVAAAAPELANAAGAIIMAFINEIAKRLPQIYAAGLDMVIGFLKALRDRIGEITTLAIDIVLEFISAIDSRLGDIIQKGVDFILSFVEGLAKAIRGEKERTGEAGADLAMALVEGMISGLKAFVRMLPPQVEALARAAVTAFKKFLGINSPSTVFTGFGVDIVMGLINGIGKLFPNLGSKARELGQAGITAIRALLPNWANTGIDFVTNMVSGVGRTASQLSSKAREAVTGAINAAKNMDASEIGRAVVNGMVKGISGGLSLVTNAARNLAKGALDSAKNFLGIKSPSKEFQKIGQFVNQGFVKGLTEGKRETATATYNNMRDVLKAAMDEATKSVKHHEAGLKSLMGARVKDQKAIADHKNQIAISRAEYAKASAAHKELTQTHLLAQRRITALSDEYTRLSPKLEEANKVLEDAIKTRDDYAKSTAAQYGKLNEVTPESGVTEYVEGVRKKAEETKKFSTLLQQLRDQGLNDAAYQDILAKGLDALPFVEKLANLGMGSVQELNKVTAQLQSEAKVLGDRASKALYQAGVDSAQGMVNGIKGRQSAIVKEMEALATAMLQAIKRKLGIKSPSREFAKLGGFASSGMAKGIKAGVGEITSASEFMANKSLRAMRETMDRLSNGLSAEMDLNPTIAPVLDLDGMRKEASNIGKVLGKQAIALDGAYTNARAASRGYDENRSAASEATSATPIEEKQINFTQINNSPKALSPAEIYRNTKNQLSVARGALV